MGKINNRVNSKPAGPVDNCRNGEIFWNGGGGRWVSYIPDRDDNDAANEIMNGMHIVEPSSGDDF